MDKSDKMISMEKELEQLNEQLGSYEKALRADAAVAAPQPAPRSDVPVKTTAYAAEVTDERYKASLKELTEQIEEMKRRLEQLDEISNKLELLDEMDEELNYIKNFLDTKLNIDFEAMYHNVLEQMNVEAIKVYRNIQAVIVEEDAKQNHVLFGVDGKSDKLKFRMNHVMIFSIISFVVSILVMLMQILPALGIQIF